MTTTDTKPAPAELQAQAREAFRASVERGEPLSRKALGELFGRKESWARDRIAEARQQADMSDDTGGTVPTVTPDMPPTATVPLGDEKGLRNVETPGGGQQVTARAVTATATPDMSPDTSDNAASDSAGDIPVQHHVGARLVCWLGFLLGTAVSVAANWLAAWLPAAQHGPTWRPDPWSQGFAAVWPVALVVSVEVLSRVAWPSGRGWALVRYGGMVAVALCSGVISYGHIHDVLLSWGYGALGAAVGPLVIDGLMVVSGFGLLALSKGRGNR